MAPPRARAASPPHRPRPAGASAAHAAPPPIRMTNGLWFALHWANIVLHVWAAARRLLRLLCRLVYTRTDSTPSPLLPTPHTALNLVAEALSCAASYRLLFVRLDARARRTLRALQYAMFAAEVGRALAAGLASDHWLGALRHARLDWLVWCVIFRAALDESGKIASIWLPVYYE